MTLAEKRAQLAIERRIAAVLVYEAKLKEHEAAAWLGLPNNLQDARANAHSALDAVLDAIENQIAAIKAQHAT
jgi:hypothetical protein